MSNFQEVINEEGAEFARGAAAAIHIFAAVIAIEILASESEADAIFRVTGLCENLVDGVSKAGY